MDAIFIAGGHIADYTGYPHAVIFDPATNGFTSLPDMNTGRWYPTTTTLPNGDVLVVSGDINSNTNVDALPQVFQIRYQDMAQSDDGPTISTAISQHAGGAER